LRAAVPPDPRQIPRFIAEPPQEGLPYGRWAEVLGERFREACAQVEAEEDIGEPGQIVWFPDRRFGGRTYVPATAPTANGFELYGFVSFTREHEGAEARAFEAFADYTDETSEANPDWELDLSEHVIGAWRGPEGRAGELALVWGVALVSGGAIATAELGPETTDQCVLADDRFTLVSLDAYTGDFLEIRLYDRGGRQLAAESLYEEE
jgi:hypothetical protein